MAAPLLRSTAEKARAALASLQKAGEAFRPSITGVHNSPEASKTVQGTPQGLIAGGALQVKCDQCQDRYETVEVFEHTEMAAAGPSNRQHQVSPGPESLTKYLWRHWSQIQLTGR